MRGITEVARRLQSLSVEHDLLVAICSCLAIIILVVERWCESKEVGPVELPGMCTSNGRFHSRL